jgi:hypothetical protein
VAAAVCVAQPLHRADADGTIKAALAQRDALAHVTQQHITLNLKETHGQHRRIQHNTELKLSVLHTVHVHM